MLSSASASASRSWRGLQCQHGFTLPLLLCYASLCTCAGASCWQRLKANGVVYTESASCHLAPHVRRPLAAAAARASGGRSGVSMSRWRLVCQMHRSFHQLLRQGQFVSRCCRTCYCCTSAVVQPATHANWRRWHWRPACPAPAAQRIIVGIPHLLALPAMGALPAPVAIPNSLRRMGAAMTCWRWRSG